MKLILLFLMCTMCAGFPRNGKGKKGFHLNEGKDWAKVECKTDDDCKIKKGREKCSTDCKDGHCNAKKVSCSQSGPPLRHFKVTKEKGLDESDNKDWSKVKCKTRRDCKYISEKWGECRRGCDDGYCKANDIVPCTEQGGFGE